jgi:hypothetical protein
MWRAEPRNDGNDSEFADVAAVSSEIFHAFEVKPVMGCLFSDAEKETCGNTMGVIGYAFMANPFTPAILAFCSKTRRGR